MKNKEILFEVDEANLNKKQQVKSVGKKDEKRKVRNDILNRKDNRKNNLSPKN
jgi:hypothetical protein